MPAYYTGNYWLSMDEMKVNATYIYGKLNQLGWTLNAISGLLGNTQTESHHNPGIWQNLNVGVGPAYGLVQWDPFTKYTNWCTENGLEPSAMDSAIGRIQWEIENNQQWVKHDSYPLTFKQFTQSTEAPYYLGMAFLHNYEMPGDLNQPARGTQAEYWYEYLSGEEPPGPTPGGDNNTYLSGKCLNPAIYSRVIINRRYRNYG